MAAKPLTWRKPTDHPQDSESAIWVANGIGGRYSITDENGDYLLWLSHDEFIWKSYRTIIEAKAAAEDDWQKRFAAQMAEPTEPAMRIPAHADVADLPEGAIQPIARTSNE